MFLWSLHNCLEFSTVLFSFKMSLPFVTDFLDKRVAIKWLLLNDDDNDDDDEALLLCSVTIFLCKRVSKRRLPLSKSRLALSSSNAFNSSLSSCIWKWRWQRKMKFLDVKVFLPQILSDLSASLAQVYASYTVNEKDRCWSWLIWFWNCGNLNMMPIWEAIIKRKIYGRGRQSRTLTTRGQSRMFICKIWNLDESCSQSRFNFCHSAISKIQE